MSDTVGSPFQCILCYVHINVYTLRIPLVIKNYFRTLKIILCVSESKSQTVYDLTTGYLKIGSLALCLAVCTVNCSGRAVGSLFFIFCTTYMYILY